MFSGQKGSSECHPDEFTWLALVYSGTYRLTYGDRVLYHDACFFLFFYFFLSDRTHPRRQKTNWMRRRPRQAGVRA